MSAQYFIARRVLEPITAGKLDLERIAEKQYYLNKVPQRVLVACRGSSFRITAFARFLINRNVLHVQ